MKTITVLLTDDHVMVRQGLRAVLDHETDILVVGEASNGREAITLTRDLHPDVVVMDIAMPLLNGLEALRQILRILPCTKILMLSAYNENTHVDQAIALGAVGYLTKQTASSDLSKAIRRVQQGHSFFSPTIGKEQPRRRAPGGRAGHNMPAVRLSSRETEILQLIAEGKLNKETAGELGISIKTVANHRQSLMKKLGIHDTAGLTRYAISTGTIESKAQILIT